MNLKIDERRKKKTTEENFRMRRSEEKKGELWKTQQGQPIRIKKSRVGLAADWPAVTGRNMTSGVTLEGYFCSYNSECDFFENYYSSFV